MGQKVNVAQRTLRDIRDNNSYTIRKLADGKCWMTQNLRLTGPKTLAPSNSNVSSNWTLPAPSSVAQSSCVDEVYHAFSGVTVYGNYYNWYAATAGTGTCSMTGGATVAASICPKGWRLPTGGGGEAYALTHAYSSAANMLEVPVSLQLSGSPIGEWGASGSYWLNEATTAGTARRLYIDSTTVGPLSDMYKYYGLTVRCIGV